MGEDLIGMYALSLIFGSVFTFDLIMKLLFQRKAFFCYLRGEWYKEGNMEYKLDYWLNPIAFRPTPEALRKAVLQFGRHGGKKDE